MIPFLPLFENKKVWGLPYLRIEKLQEILFMFFERYAIHIQAFVHFITGNLSFPDPHLHRIILGNIYSK